jgi:hypothetical protein
MYSRESPTNSQPRRLNRQASLSHRDTPQGISLRAAASMEEIDLESTAPPADIGPIGRSGLMSVSGVANAGGGGHNALTLGLDTRSLPASRAASRAEMTAASSPSLFANTALRNHLAEVWPGLLYIGPMKAAVDIELVRHFRICAFLCVATEVAPIPPFVTDHDLMCGAVAVKHIQITDSGLTRLREYFGEAFAFIDEQAAAGRPVALYCQQGKSRSASFAVAYLMRELRWSSDEALRYLKSVYPAAEPNLGFLLQLKDFSASLPPSFHQLPQPHAASGGRTSSTTANSATNSRGSGGSAAASGAQLGVSGTQFKATPNVAPIFPLPPYGQSMSSSLHPLRSAGFDESSCLPGEDSEIGSGGGLAIVPGSVETLRYGASTSVASPPQPLPPPKYDHTKYETASQQSMGGVTVSTSGSTIGQSVPPSRTHAPMALPMPDLSVPHHHRRKHHPHEPMSPGDAPVVARGNGPTIARNVPPQFTRVSTSPATQSYVVKLNAADTPRPLTRGLSGGAGWFTGTESLNASANATPASNGMTMSPGDRPINVPAHQLPSYSATSPHAGSWRRSLTSHPLGDGPPAVAGSLYSPHTGDQLAAGIPDAARSPDDGHPLVHLPTPSYLRSGYGRSRASATDASPSPSSVGSRRSPAVVRHRVVDVTDVVDEDVESEHDGDDASSSGRSASRSSTSNFDAARMAPSAGRPVVAFGTRGEPLEDSDDDDDDCEAVRGQAAVTAPTAMPSPATKHAPANFSVL